MSKQTVRTTVEGDVFAELQAQADDKGVSLFIHLRQVLTAQAAVAAPPPAVTAEQWAGLREWVRVDIGRLNGYPGPRKWNDPLNRAAVYQWAQQNGFTPS